MASSSSSVLTERSSIGHKNDAALITECHDIASEIQLGRRKLCTFVEELEPFLTNKDVDAREKGVTMLSLVLAQMPKDFLTESELYFITVFFCDRLKDHHSIIPVILEGILSIVQMTHLPQESPLRLFRALFECISCQSQPLQDRRNIYLIFKTLLANRKDDLKAMELDFVYGVISAIDGERDPSNLLLLFNILPNFLKEFKLGHLTEEMFEIISCYFPIDFNPTTSDKLGITRDDLSEALAPCLCAIPEFAEFCIPLITDKLSSTLKVAKMDSLKLLCKGAPTFGVKGLEDHLIELWSVLQKEVMPGGDPEVKALALKAIMTLLDVISNEEAMREVFVDKIITDAKSSLCDVRLSLFGPVVKLLESVAKVNKTCCIHILRTIIPLGLGQYSTKTTIDDKVILLEMLNNFMQICSDFGFSVKDVPELAWTDIPRLYLDELTVQDLELKTKLITGLTIQRVSLNNGHRETLYQNVCKEIDRSCNQTKNICHSSLLSFTALYPEEILVLVEKQLSLQLDDSEIQKRIYRLEALTAIATTKQLGTEIIPKIVDMSMGSQIELSLAAFTCLQRLVVTKNIDFDVHQFLHKKCNIINKLISFNINVDDNRLIHMSSICQSVLRNLDTEEQQTIMNKYIKTLPGDVSTAETMLIISLFVPLRQNVSLNIDDKLLQIFYNLACNCTNINMRQMSCKLLAVILNKMANNDQFESTLRYLNKRIKDDLQSNTNIERKQSAVTLQVWLTKAVVTKGTPNSQQFLELLVNTLRDSEVNKYMAEQFKVLVNKDENTLTTENYCNVKIFYKQRIFQYLIQQNDSFQESLRHIYLTALLYLLEEVPVELLFMDINQVVPLLTECLSLDTGQLVLPTLVTLKLLLDSKNNIFSVKVQSFIPRLLNLSTHNSMKVRITALECLASYCNYSIAVILPYKQDVIDKLGTVLDDHKRLVRKAAVNTRTRWFLLGAPGTTTE